jgi:antitoxin PrlF
MEMYYSKLTTKGQTTIPVEVRNLLNLKPGDKIRYMRTPAGIVMKAKNAKAADLAGILHKPGMKALSVQQMDESMAEEIANHTLGRR